MNDAQQHLRLHRVWDVVGVFRMEKNYLAVTCADRSCFPLLLGKRCYTVTRMAACDVLYTKSCAKIQWVGLRENLQETIDFPMKYGMFLQFFP